MSKSLFFWVVAIVATIGSKLDADLNEPKILNQKIASSNKKVVLIYVANESAYHKKADENHRQIVRWLTSSKEQTIRELGKSIDKDRRVFADIVDEELSNIYSAKEVASKFGVVIFTNRMASKNIFSLRRPSCEQFETVEFKLDRSGDFIDASHPFTVPGALHKALSKAATIFSPAEFDFVLITKSHGTVERPLIPRLGIDARETSKEQLVSTLVDAQRTKSVGKEVWCPGANELALYLGTSRTGNLGTSQYGQLGTSKTGNLGSRKGKLLIGSKGISKARYTECLQTVGRKLGMQFKLVFIESCQSQLSPEQSGGLHNIVGTVFTSDDKGLPYQTIDYPKLFESMRKGADLTHALTKQLKK